MGEMDTQLSGFMEKVKLLEVCFCVKKKRKGKEGEREREREREGESICWGRVLIHQSRHTLL